ncbi:MAG: hypothetical protein GY913_32380 [Proteobacteria bacterium]|nr:hypothetical protein [Pseudomonadota bacterium]MCP4921619.1 hypothetical protein [Pseudomonadota bacterium]
MTNILVVCTGNICRSPMAEGLFADYARRRGRKIQVKSASVLGLNGKPAHKHAIAVMKEISLDISGHKAQPVTNELMEWADYVLGMEINHSATLRDRYPLFDDKILLLPTFGGLVELADPLGGWRRRFRKSREDIQRCSMAFIDQIPA